jgi:hypothetical protein
MVKSRVPKYSFHKPTGQAFVRVNGKFIYLGSTIRPSPARSMVESLLSWPLIQRQPVFPRPRNP